MKIITVSREFGSGGRELGKRLADLLHFDYYDSEIITAVAQNIGADAGYVEKALSNHGWQNYPVTFRRTLSPAAHARCGKVELLLAQKRVLEEIASLGKDCVIVGRNADVILKKYHPFNIFVCANTDAKLRRCIERAPQGESLSEREMLRRMKQIDASRAETRSILTGSAWGTRCAYHLTINTTDWRIKDLASASADFAARWFERTV